MNDRSLCFHWVGLSEAALICYTTKKFHCRWLRFQRFVVHVAQTKSNQPQGGFDLVTRSERELLPPGASLLMLQVNPSLEMFLFVLFCFVYAK